MTSTQKEIDVDLLGSGGFTFRKHMKQKVSMTSTQKVHMKQKRSMKWNRKVNVKWKKVPDV
jgi:hypothetical protein